MCGNGSLSNNFFKVSYILIFTFVLALLSKYFNLQIRFLDSLTVWLCGVRDFEMLHFQVTTEPIRLFIFSFFTPIVKDELAVLQRRTAVGLPTETRITFTYLLGTGF